MASDAMTRGMDVESVAHVVNYDAPVYAKTYVHRCGRTARAGRQGRAFTLLRKQVQKPYMSDGLYPKVMVARQLRRIPTSGHECP